MKDFKKYIAIVFLIISSLLIFSACETEEESLRERTRTVVLEQEAALYEEPDGRSAQVGSVKASQKVEYISIKKVDGIKWYETDQGWFSVFVPTDHKGHVISSGFAKSGAELLCGPAASAAVTGTVEAGAYLEVFQVRDLWSQTAKGWILTENLYIPGHMGDNAGWCLTLHDGVGCYSEPNTDSMKVKDYRSLYRLRLYEILIVDQIRWGYTDGGWIDLSEAYVEGETGEGACHVKVIDTTALNVRVGPGTGYDIIKSLPVGSYTDVLFQVYTENNYWGFNGSGWIYMGLVKAEEG